MLGRKAESVGSLGLVERVRSSWDGNESELRHEKSSEAPTQSALSRSAVAEVAVDVAGLEARLRLADVQRAVVWWLAKAEPLPDGWAAVDGVESRARQGIRTLGIVNGQAGTSEGTPRFIQV